MSDQGPQIAVIGLDGADWRLLQPWLDGGHLPTLKRLIDQGASGKLASTIRPESSVAWTSFATGVNPGKHGIFGFMSQTDQVGQFQIASGRLIQANRFWDLLGRADKTVGLINIPFTFPPRPVNGHMMTGMLTPSDAVEFTYPPAFKAELVNRFSTLMFDAGDDVTDKQKLLENSRQFTQQQIETTLHILEKQAPDFISVVFTALDRLQHFFWEDLDLSHPSYSAERSPQFQQAMLDHLKHLDSGIEQIIAKLNENATIMLISDHGFNSFARRFYVNRWLMQKGLLVIEQTQNRRNDLLVQLLEKMKNVGILRRIKRAVLPSDWGPQKLAATLNTQAIDWSKTEAYYAPDGGLRLNPEKFQGSSNSIEALQLLSRLKEELLSLVDPETGARPIAQIYRAQDLYHGDQTRHAPDLIIEPQRSSSNPQENFIIDGSWDRPQPIFSSSSPYSGNHDLDGIFAIHGPGIVPQTESSAHIMDIAPTILAAFDVPIPNYMDGNPLVHLFEDGQRPKIRHVELPILEQDIDVDRHIPSDASDETLDELVSDRLRNLGYLD